MAGKDRSDPSILLEVYDWLRDREDCNVVILGSGDSDYQVLIDRAPWYGPSGDPVRLQPVRRS